MKKLFTGTYKHIISIENLLEAWREFIVGKKARKDVQLFERNLMTNIIALHRDLASKTYQHSAYEAFNISDPKPRNIHKASVRDRLLHHALYRKLYPFFDRTFIPHSYSCRFGKGTYKAIEAFSHSASKVSCNHTRTVWVLKCDIRKFFAIIDHQLLIDDIKEYISDKDIIWLLSGIVKSFHSTREGVGLPLGNLTSQLLVNVYMNRFDQFVKHTLKVKHYIRYADDFVVLSEDKEKLKTILERIGDFLQTRLRLSLHPDKVSINTVASGVDFLGWVHFPDHRVMRTATKRRAFRGIKKTQGKNETVQSYLGLLKHGNAHKFRAKVENFLQSEQS
jgi:RNA-directed DNA polymerase